jgi:hypothetical protein
VDCMHLEDQPSGSSQVTDSHRSSRQGSRGNGNPIVIGVNTMSVLCTICFDRWERMVISGSHTHRRIFRTIVHKLHPTHERVKSS